MINNYDFDPCTQGGCDKRTGHYSGKCIEHRDIKCAKHGCKALFTPRNMNMIYCKEHRKRRREIERIANTVNEDW